MAQEIVNFENGKYVWEEISGKGKSLVPYKEPPKPKFTPNMIRAGRIIELNSYSTGILISFSIHGTFIFAGLPNGGNANCAWSLNGNQEQHFSATEFCDLLNNTYPEARFLD
jgi:hypothetical protein